MSKSNCLMYLSKTFDWRWVNPEDSETALQLMCPCFCEKSRSTFDGSWISRGLLVATYLNNAVMVCSGVTFYTCMSFQCPVAWCKITTIAVPVLDTQISYYICCQCVALYIRLFRCSASKKLSRRVNHSPIKIYPTKENLELHSMNLAEDEWDRN